MKDISKILISKLILDESMSVKWLDDEELEKRIRDAGEKDEDKIKLVQGYCPSDGDLIVFMRKSTETNKSFLLLHESIHAIIRVDNIKIENKCIEESIANCLGLFFCICGSNDRNSININSNRIFYDFFECYSHSSDVDIKIELIKESCAMILTKIINKWCNQIGEEALLMQNELSTIIENELKSNNSFKFIKNKRIEDEFFRNFFTVTENKLNDL